MRILLLFLISICGSAFYVHSNDASFLFKELVFRIDGKDIGSNNVPIYENLDVGVVDISGYLIEDGNVELGMEVVITDVDANRLLYSPDMLENTKLTVKEVPKLHFNINLNEDFREGGEYFIKIKIWDKKTNKSYSKHTSFIVTDAIRNENVYIDVRRLNVAGYKFYLNGDRLYKTNYIRVGDEMIIDMFFTDLEIEQNEDIVIVTEIIDEQNSVKMPLENEFVIADKNEEVKTVLIKNTLYDQRLKAGESYLYHMQFHNASRNQKLDMKFRIEVLNADWKTGSVKVAGVNMEIEKNREKTSGTPVLEIGDRIDFSLVGFPSRQRSDFGFGKIGGKIQVYNSDGEKVYYSRDLFSKNPLIVLKDDEPIQFTYVVPSSLAPNEKYSIELSLWDKYSEVYTIKKFGFKTTKEKLMPYGLQENLYLKCKFMESRVKPLAVYVNQNGYKIFTNSLKPLDEIELITAINLEDGKSPQHLIRYVELYNENGDLLIRDEEEIKDFLKGEIIASMIIPEEGIEYNRNYSLVAILEDGEQELMKVEYKFQIEK
ncbi:MAG: hypothetical protein KDC84_05360 [Crocinitomicaceae bacterium]|nr:hypothetical protein [Crocinitomicaceae bacterium]